MMHIKRRPTHRILKQKVPSFISHQGFTLPQTNRYFAKVVKSPQSFSLSLEQPEHRYQKEDKQSTATINKSFSFTLSRKKSLKNDDINDMRSNFSLPKLGQSKSMTPQEGGEIIKSQLGCFNIYNILKLKEQLDERREKEKLKEMVQTNRKVSSEEHEYASDDNNQEQLNNAVIEQQIPYERYDELLMRKEPIYSRKRVLQLKHKADWRIQG